MIDVNKFIERADNALREINSGYAVTDNPLEQSFLQGMANGISAMKIVVSQLVEENTAAVYDEPCSDKCMILKFPGVKQ